jgi:hypothetical protein
LGNNCRNFSFITFEFGEPKLNCYEFNQQPKNIHERQIYVHGEWHLLIYCCDCKIFQNGYENAHCESSDKTIDKALSHLDGQKIVSLEIDSANKSCSFTFDLGGLLEITSNDCYQPMTD